MKALSAVPSVVKVPPEATVTLPAPLTVELPLELDSRVSVPSTVTALGTLMSALPLPPLPVTVWPTGTVPVRLIVPRGLERPGAATVGQGATGQVHRVARQGATGLGEGPAALGQGAGQREGAGRLGEAAGPAESQRTTTGHGEGSGVGGEVSLFCGWWSPRWSPSPRTGWSPAPG